METHPRLILWSRTLAALCYLTGAAFGAALVANALSGSWPEARVSGAWTLAALVSGTVVDLLSALASRR